MTAINIMSLRHSAFYSPLLVCISGGFLHEEGLEPHYEVQTPERTVVDTIRRGETHLAQSAVATSFAALEQGEEIDIVHFAQINERDGFFIAGRELDENFDWHKLIGRKVLVDHFFQPMAMFNYALHKQGINLAELEVIDVGDVAVIDQAFRNGQGDYVHQQGPAPQQMEQDGIAHVVASVGDVIGPVAFSSLCASRDWLQTDMARAFMRAYRKARAWMIAAPVEELADKVKGFFPEIDLAVLTHTLGIYQKLGCWTPDPVISERAYETLLDVFLHSGLITQRHPYNAAIVAPPA
ncbi:MAG: ABC transporter substrate-binding protein [Gammaproteobacteria bacterium]|nr:ABC transporter substrate-binding protein [Gammaproteobacteria bacterium]